MKEKYGMHCNLVLVLDVCWALVLVCFKALTYELSVPQATILDAVLPVWSHPHMASTSIAGSGIVTHILKKCTEETMPLPAAAGRAAQRAEIAPDPAIVQQCVEMGFSETRVQEALRRVRPWPITYPRG